MIYKCYMDGKIVYGKLAGDVLMPDTNNRHVLLETSKGDYLVVPFKDLYEVEYIKDLAYKALKPAIKEAAFFLTNEGGNVSWTLLLRMVNMIIDSEEGKL